MITQCKVEGVDHPILMEKQTMTQFKVEGVDHTLLTKGQLMTQCTEEKVLTKG